MDQNTGPEDRRPHTVTHVPLSAIVEARAPLHDLEEVNPLAIEPRSDSGPSAAALKHPL